MPYNGLHRLLPAKAKNESNRNLKGFTLIEIMAVLIILSVIAVQIQTSANPGVAILLATSGFTGIQAGRFESWKGGKLEGFF
jgi:prepilin-type N-terminal cleavage/methylation domain-containing protein